MKNQETNSVQPRSRPSGDDGTTEGTPPNNRQDTGAGSSHLRPDTSKRAAESPRNHKVPLPPVISPKSPSALQGNIRENEPSVCCWCLEPEHSNNRLLSCSRTFKGPSDVQDLRVYECGTHCKVHEQGNCKIQSSHSGAATRNGVHLCRGCHMHRGLESGDGSPDAEDLNHVLSTPELQHVAKHMRLLSLLDTAGSKLHQHNGMGVAFTAAAGCSVRALVEAGGGGRNGPHF